MSVRHSEWIPFGVKSGKSVFFRKMKVYDMEWKIDLQTHLLRVAPFGGPIAVVRDPTKVVRLDDEDIRMNIRIFAPNGRLMTTIPWPACTHPLIEFGWTADEDLVLVFKDGTVYVYGIHGGLLKEFTMGERVASEGIACACVWAHGVFCITNSTYQQFSVNNLLNPQPVPLQDPTFIEPPRTFDIVPPDNSTNGEVVSFISPVSSPFTAVDGKESGAIYISGETSTKEQEIKEGPIVSLKVSPNGSFVTMFTNEGLLSAKNVGFTMKVMEWNSNSKVAPRQIMWCGMDAVALHWDPAQLNKEMSLVVLVNDQGEMRKITYDTAVFLAQEVDCLRIISKDKHEIVQRVPDPTVEIDDFGSTAPSASLMEAYDQFSMGDANAVATTTFVRDRMPEAVDSCIRSAMFELEVEEQMKLLKAASYGKTFCEFYDKDQLMEASKRLRILNEVRRGTIALPITYTQFEALGVKGVVERLVQRNFHLMAVRICEYMDLEPDRVYMHWAFCKVMSREDDETVCQGIRRMFQRHSGLSYASVAEKALQEKRRGLAVKLLELESQIEKQVPLLMKIGEMERALDISIHSGDVELVYHVLLEIRKVRSDEEFFALIRDKEFARHLSMGYYRQEDLEFLLKIYYALDLPVDAAMTAITDAYTRLRFNPMNGAVMKEETGRDRAKFLRYALAQLTKRKEAGLYARCLDDQIKLMEAQVQFERAMNEEFFGLSVTDTLYKLVKLGQHKIVKRFREDLKIAEKRYYWVKIRALADARDWDTLFQFSKEKKSPIGYRPFVLVCKDAGQMDEGMRYVERLADIDEKVETFADLGKVADAANMAFQAKNTDALQNLRMHPQASPADRQRIDTMLQQLQ